MTANHPEAEPHDDHTVPLWMRKSTLWVVLGLSVGVFALAAYYLVPLWWARLVGVWVASSSSLVAGLAVGFFTITVGVGAFRSATAIPVVDDEGHLRGKALHLLRLALSVLAGLALVVLMLTVSIALGFTQPLAQARELWQENSPGVLSASLVGALLGVIVVLGVYSLIFWRRSRHQEDGAQAPDADESGPSS